jgi:nitroreductase
MKASEAHEHIEETLEGHRNRRVAILIAILAAMLALAEMGGGQAKQDSLNANIEASNLWAFFQAKTIRQTMLRTTSELAEFMPAVAPERSDAFAKRLDAWKATVARYESEPDTGEGRRELMARAKAAEALRDRALAADHVFELASAALQLGIVLASAAVITGALWLAFTAVGLGVVGTAFIAIGWTAPVLIHF